MTTNTSNYDNDICVSGYYDGIRAAPKPFHEHAKEIIHNSLEAIRLAEKNNNSKIISSINLKIYLDSNERPEKFEFEDISTSGTGIKNLESKNILTQYRHEGEKSGFSEYGEGGSEATKQIADCVIFESVTETGTSESLILYKDCAIKENNFKKSAKYSNEGIYKPRNNFSTGTKVTLTKLTDSYKTKELGNQCLTGELAKRLSNSFIQINLTLLEFKIIVCKNNEIVKDFDIIPTNNLREEKQEYNLCIYKHNETEELICVVNNNKNNKKVTYEEGRKKTFQTKTDVENSLKKSKAQVKKNFDVLYNEKYDLDNYTKITTSYAILHLSTETDERLADIKKMGFDGHRRVEGNNKGNNIVKTNSEPLELQWGLFRSHRTRYKQFRGAMEYDRNWDIYLGSDKSKTISDDRPFITPIKNVIQGLTKEYFASMKKLGYYDTDKKKEDNDDDNSNDNDNQDVTAIEAIEKEAEVMVPAIEAIEEEAEVMVPAIEAIEEEAEVMVPAIETIEEEAEVMVPAIETIEEEAEVMVTVIESIEEEHECMVTAIESIEEEHECMVTVIETNEEINQLITTNDDGTIELQTIHRKANNAQYANKEKINIAIDNALAKQNCHTSFNEALEDLFNIHQKNIFEIMYKKFTIEQKAEIFKQYLDFNYPVDTMDIPGGSAFIRMFNEFIKEE
jgi:hypothetical protein